MTNFAYIQEINVSQHCICNINSLEKKAKARKSELPFIKHTQCSTNTRHSCTATLCPKQCGQRKHSSSTKAEKWLFSNNAFFKNLGIYCH